MRDERRFGRTAGDAERGQSVNVRVEVCQIANERDSGLAGCDAGCWDRSWPDAPEDEWDGAWEEAPWDVCDGGRGDSGDDWDGACEDDLAAELARHGIWIADDDEVALLAETEARALFENSPHFTDMDRHVELGRIGEKVAQSYLSNNGFVVLDVNWRCPFGEADIVAADDGDLVFVEVKTRSGLAEGFPEEAVTPAKRTRYERIASSYLLRERPEGSFRIRFDVVAILVLSERCAFLRHHRNAFEAADD